MTRKDYEAIASALRAYREAITEYHAATMLARHKLDAVDDIAEILGDIFAADNPRFQAARFRQATR